MYRLTINFNFIFTVNNVLTSLCHGEHSKCHLVGRMKTSAPLINAIVTNALFHSNSHPS